MSSKGITADRSEEALLRFSGCGENVEDTVRVGSVKRSEYGITISHLLGEFCKNGVSFRLSRVKQRSMVISEDALLWRGDADGE